MNINRFRFDDFLIAFLLFMTILIPAVTSSTALSDSKPGTYNTSSVSGNNVRIWLNGDAVGRHPGWNDSSPGPIITVTSGETVTLLLNATDNLLHNWFVDSNDNGQVDPNEIASPDFSAGSTNVLSFRFTPIIGQNVPSSGNWTYRCRYHPYPYMYGIVRVVQPDFSLSASPSTLKAATGTPATSTITASPLFHFNETIGLSVTSSSGLSATITPGNLAIASGAATLTALAISIGNYTATVIGTSGSLTHSLVLAVQVGDFSISANPATSFSQVNSLANSTITVTTLNHFIGIMDLTSNSASCSLNPTRLAGPGKSTLTCTFATAGPNRVIVTCASGSLSHSATVVFNVTAPPLADFAISAANTTVSLHRGSHTNDAIELKSIGFSGTISLSVTTSLGSLRHRLRANLENSSITLSQNSASSTVLRLSAQHATSPGGYVVTITARSGSITRSVTIMALVSSRHK